MTTFAEKLNVLRAGVLGANDGIVSIAGVVIGVAAASQDSWVIFLSGMAAILAGAFSMAGGEYVSVSTQKDTERSAMQREQQLYDQSPDLARESLYSLYLAKGECETSAMVLTNKAFAQHPVKHLVEEKYNLEFDTFTSPFVAALSSFLAFIAGAIFPMLAILLLPTGVRIPGTMLVVGISLFLTGYTSARLGQAPVLPAVRRNVLMGLLTMLVTFGIGSLFGIG